MLIEFFVPGKAVGKGRPRFTRSGHAYTPATTREYEKRVQVAYRLAEAHRGPSDARMRASLHVSAAIPVSWTRKKKAEALEGKISPGKPDIDNIVKAIFDACNGLVFVDDAQIVDLTATKKYGPAEEEGVTVRFETID